MSLEGGNLKATQDYFEKSLTLREQLAHQEPDNAQTRRDLAVSYSGLGNASLKGVRKAARGYFEKSLHLTEQLAHQDPENAQ